MYTTSYGSRDAPLRERMLEHLEPLFVKNNVTLALWGHVHWYERFCPLKNFTCGSMGLKGEGWEALPVHVVIGMAGQDWRPTWEPRPDHPNDPVFPQPKMSLYRTGEFGYTRLVATKEKLTLSFSGNHDGEVHDMVEILAFGQVINGGDGDSGKVDAVLEDEAMQYSFSHFVWGGSVLVLGGFVGYVLNFVSHASKRAASGRG